MDNLIQKHRAFVAGQIEKSFDSEIEKAYAVGDTKDFNGRTYYVHALNAKGQPLWRLKEKKTGNKPSARKPGSTDEIERMDSTKVRQAILGLNNIATNVKDKGDYFHIEFDANDFNTHGQRSPQIDRIAKFLEGMGASCVIGKNSIKAYKKIESEKKDGKVDISKIPDKEFKQITYMLQHKNPNASDAFRNLEEEAMSDKELKNFYACAEHYKNDSNINKLTQEYCKKWAELAKEELESRKQTNKSDIKQDKIAQNAGFKDYEEMRGYQNYVTAKNLLKKRSMQASTKAAHRKELEKQITDYEKDHKDVIDRIKNKKK